MSSFIEDMEAPLQGRDDSIRLALNAPQPFSAGEVSQKDRAAQQLGTTYGMADAGWDDVQTEMKVQNASRVPKANEWVAEAQENVAFLNEDADALMSVYDDLVANGLLAESDIDRDTMETVAEDGNGLGKALDRARINNQLADLGQSFLKGEVLGDDARREAARLHEELARQEGNDPLGFYGAVEQLYRMGTRDLPNILYRGAQGALEGASAGAIAGTVIPGLGSVAGAGTGAAAGFTAGAARGTFESSQQMEAALFALDLLMQTDDAGQYLDDDTVKNYAQLYGMGSAFVETAGDALALKILSPMLKTVGAAIKRPASSVAKDAIKTAMSDRRLAPVLGRAVRGVAAGAAAEGAEEAAQQAISEQIEALAKNTLNDAGVNYYREDQPGLFGKDAWGNIAESAVEGAKMGMWFHLLPGVTKFAIDTQSVLRAQEFSEANKNALKTIESSKTQQLSPVRMESFLKRQGLNQTVLVPADAAWQMQQAGTDIAGAFGWNIADMEEAAALGQDIAVPLSRIHAAQIPTDDKNTLFDVMRERPESMSAFEAMDESVLAEDVDAVNAAVEEWEYQQDRLDMELDRVRTQITESVRSSPVLLRQLTTSADTETSVGMYVDSVMRLLRNAADRLSVYGADADSILDRLNVQGLIRDEATGRMVDPMELEQLAEERALAEADAPFWENVWGRLDAASLKRDFPEARKELASIHGRGLFAPRKGEGVPVDQLADELKTAGWLPEDADSSTLIEILKEKRRPTRRNGRRGVRLNQAMAQSQADSLEGFVEEAREGQITFWRSSRTPDALKKILNSDDIVINIPYSFVRHLDNRRREQTDRIVKQVEDVLSSADYVVRTGEKKGKPLYSAVKANGDGTSTLIVFEHNKGRRGNRVLPYSGIIENSEAIDAVVRQKERASTSTGAGGNSSSPKSLSENEVRVLEALTEDSMPESAAESNTLFQTAYHGTPHRFDEFSLEHIGEGEGAQAHGWGLYFAADKKVSDDYRNRLRRGRSRGQLFEVDIPDDDVLLDEQKIFAEQPEAVKSALRSIYKSFSKEQLAPVREEMKAQVRRDKDLEKRGEELTKKRQRLFNQRRALKTVNAQRPKGEGNPFSKEGSAKLFELGEKYLHEMYSNAQIERLQNDADYLNAEKAAVEKKIAELEQKIAENEQRIETKRAKERESIDKARLDTLLSRMNGSDLYSGISIVLDSPKAASEALNAAGIKGITYDGQQDGRAFVVFDDKAIQVLKTFYQGQETGVASQVYATATGSISSQNDNYYIQLFRGANLSTLAHETMHAVHLEMERLEREGLGTPELKRDLDALRSWTARMDDDANLKSEYDKYQRSMQQFGGRKFEELTPEERTISRSIAKEEMVARGFEAYLREGVSPSRGMEGVFRRFKKWLTRIYRQASLLDVELTDDVRRVFDNIVASDEDIRAAATANNIRTESSELMDALGLRGADRLELESLVREAEDNAADALRKDRNKAIREQAKKWTTEADEEVRSETVYRVRAAMRKTPIDYESVVESYGRDMADRLMKKLPASVKRGGDNPESLAFDYGFRNAGEMIQAVLDAPGINERRAELIVQKRRDAEARFAAEDYLFEQEALVCKEERIGEAVYRLEAEGRTSLGVPIQGDYRERSKALREQIRMQAERILDGKTAADALRPDVFRRSASKALREERLAILAKDWPAAIQANYRARINLELARQAADRRDLVEKLQKRAKAFLDSKVTDPGARFGVFVLAMKTRLINPTMKMLANAGDKTFDDIKSFLSKMREEGLYTEDAAIDDTLFEGNPIYWRDMPWNTLRPYLEAMSTMMHMERVSRKAHDEQNSVEWRQKMDGLAAGIYAHNKNRSKGSFHKDNLIIKRLKEFHASHLKADTICRLLDGDEDMGPVWRAVIRPINQATWNRATRMRKERDAIKELYSVYTPAKWVDIRGRRYYVDAIKTSITKEQALAVLLNAGNASNFERLLATRLEGGQRITEAGIRAIIDTLDERDVRFVQSVWDYLETFRKESFDLEEEISGVRPKAIEAQPVQTKYGLLRGGYYPVSYDNDQSALPIDTESIGTLSGSMFPSVDHGSMKQRTSKGLGTPLQLNLEVLPRHVVKTVHMLAFRKPVQQVARVLNDDAVIGAIESTAGVEHGKALKSWLHYVAGERPASNGWSRTLGWFRKNAALYAMGIRLTTLLAQTTGLLAATAELGPRWVACGLVRTYCQHNPFMVYQETAALSPMMANRMQSVDRDLHEMSTGLMKRGSSNRMLNPVVKFHHWQQEKAYLPMGFVQMACADLPTWQGAYAKALHEGKSRDAAIEYADNVVERTQVGGEDKDLAAIQRGSEMGKIMTQFYSYFSALYQLYARRMTMLKRQGFTDVGAWGRLGTLFLLTGVLEPILSSLVTGDTPDDDDDWYAWGTRKIFFNPFNMVIGLRDITGAVEGYLEGYGGRARVGSLVNDVIDTGVRFGTQIEKGLDMDARKMFDSGWKLAGLATGAVNSQELLIINAFWDWLGGTNPDFELAQILRNKK